TAAPNRGLHVEPSEIHSGGAGAGYSFGNRETTGFVESPAAGERWVWYSLSGVARLWSGGDKLTVTPAGNVGIGTATPEGKLDVKGEIRAGNSDLYFTRTDHNHTGIGNAEGFAAIENAANFNALMILGRSGTPQGRAVRLWDYLEVNGALHVTSNVGIGTAAPSRMLHVEPSEIHSGGFSGGFSFSDRLVAGFVESPGAGERWVWYSFGGTARLWSGWDKMAVTPAGNVGIGTTAPAYKLDVVADNAIKLGLEGNGGGRLILANNAGDNRIYIEAFSSDGLGHASELLLTGRNSAPVPQITLRAGTTFISGRLTKSSGAFKIDHPLDPENKYLYHSFVESPDMMNIYNGNVITDRYGEATVALPAYFEALNRDFRYQLTVIGQFARVIIASKIRNRRFTIKADQPHVEVSWQVTGIRRDAYANANRIEVEEDKPSSERGSLLHPEAFGRTPSEEV
ncbi:MAG TPA: hypothetical protein VJ302_36850, partial [Blastocatellia bacterium]|nr:hypothetical protein [Blastocatellia bacterium]